jgi:hypothetical protein
MAANIFLMWHRTPDDRLAPDEVAAKLERIFAPLFSRPLDVTIRQNGATAMVYLEHPMRGWSAPLFQEDNETWAVAPDYPVNAGAALSAKEKDFASLLPALGRSLQANPFQILRRMAPPFSLAWCSRLTGEAFVQNDGLGQAQLFEYEKGQLFAVTNRIFALKALGISLEPVAEEWAARWTLNWFPKTFSGYKSVRFVPPGTQLHFSPHAVTRATHDVLREWITPDHKSQEDRNELARSSLLNVIKSVAPLWEKKPTLLLSGGWDSRAVASSLKYLGLPFTGKVTGLPGRPDVMVASELARIGDLDLEIDSSGGLPPENLDDCRSSISLALLWEAGYRVTRKHKLFLIGKKDKHLGRGSPKLSGKHGEIGRGFYSTKWATESEALKQESRFVERMLEHMPRFTRKHLRDSVRDIIADAYAQADQYGFKGLQRLDFFYLYERNRRLVSGSHSAKTGLVITPFLNPDYISASFSLPNFEKVTNPFHRHIIEKNTPDWAGIPYAASVPEDELESEEMPSSENQQRWRQPVGYRNYDNRLYWENLAKPLFDECLRSSGFWTEVFDPDLARGKSWSDDADDLVITCMLPDALEGNQPAAW